jgi:hypothetical protein
VNDALRRHRWAIAAIFVASWGWALAWPHHDYTLIVTSSQRYEAHAWGSLGAIEVGKNRTRVGHLGGDELAPLGREGWFVDRGELAVECCLAMFLSVVSSIWWVAFRRPAAPGRSQRRAVAGVLAMAIWPTLVFVPAAWSIWRELGKPTPQTLIVLDPELMIAASVYLVSVIAVRLGRRPPSS